ncbi:MAG: glycogen debranching protein [Bryobacteraceae bacterium]
MPHALKLLPLALSPLLAAQTAWQATPSFPFGTSPWAITRPAQARMPFTVAGRAGAIFGQGDGSFEAWIFPAKIASHFRITAELADYPIPIELPEYAASVEVNPDHTTLTYSHAAFTVKQHMFSGTAGPVVFFEIASVRPLTLTFRFTPEMLRMWPAPNFGLPNAEWVKEGASGYYILHTDNKDFSGYIGIPGAVPGILAPYQERPRTRPLELKLSFDPKTQSKQFFPLMMATSAAQLLDLSKAWPGQYRQTADYYAHFFDRRLTAETPDASFNLALRWAELAIDQAQVRFHDETGLVAGYYSSADSARPGFGWFFGRDTLFSLYAVHSYGDFSLSRHALEFLLRRQRDDGKIMHEFSQTADLVDWKATPYFYASADSTPLLVMTMWDYVRSSGDVDFLRAHWSAVKKAWAFTRAHDSDGDGIYENTEGTGWVESWPPGMPHQEIYLAALDRQSCSAMASLSALMHEPELEAAAHSQAESIGAKIASEYFDTERQFYAFSRDADGTLDRTATIFPSVAWWDGSFELPHAEKMFERWVSPEFSTDWGLRDVSRVSSIYDPMSYHQGSVWPLYTGWTALAEYRAGRPFAGYAHLMQNAGMTFSQDLGAVTELLSGEFFQPFGRSSSHQLWSSAMVLTPALRGLFGIEADALRHILRVHPQLPAAWETAALKNVTVGAATFDLHFRKHDDKLLIEASSIDPQPLCLTAGADCVPATARIHQLELNLPAFEVDPPHALPPVGSSTVSAKILSESETGFEIEGLAGSAVALNVRFVGPPVQVSGASLEGGELIVRFPAGEGYQRATVRFTFN